MFLKSWKERLQGDPYQTSTWESFYLASCYISYTQPRVDSRNRDDTAVSKTKNLSRCDGKETERERGRFIVLMFVMTQPLTLPALVDLLSVGREVFVIPTRPPPPCFHAPISHSVVAVSRVEPLGKSIYCRL